MISNNKKQQIALRWAENNGHLKCGEVAITQVVSIGLSTA